MTDPISQDSLDAFEEAAKASCAACSGLDLRAAAARLAADGLLGVLAPEPLGSGLEPAFALPVMKASGRARLAFPLADAIAGATTLASLAPEQAEAVLKGEKILVVAPAATLSLMREGASWLVSGQAGFVPFIEDADLLLAAADSDGARALVLIDLTLNRPAIGRREEIDVERPRATIRIDGAALAVTQDAALIHAFMQTSDLLLAADLHGAAWGAFDHALGHLSTREQFGKVLASFQALRHDLARHRMALESGERLLRHAAAANGDERGFAVAMALAHASETCPVIAESALHMQGGMGFTWDVPAHLWLRRILASLGADDAAARRDAVIAQAIPRALAAS